MLVFLVPPSTAASSATAKAATCAFSATAKTPAYAEEYGEKDEGADDYHSYYWPSGGSINMGARPKDALVRTCSMSLTCICPSS
jgi:hypothetical protein